MIRVLLVDDHPPIIDSVERALAQDPEIHVLGSAHSLAAADRFLATSTPDVVVCDVQLGSEADGLRLLERFGARSKFVMLSGYEYGSLFRAAFERGAAGYVLKTAELPTIVAAVRTVASGGTVFSAASMRIIRQALRRPSAREIDVLELVARGASNEEVAAHLVLSLKTVESHLRRLFDRYGVMNRTELALLAVREGWVVVG